MFTKWSTYTAFENLDRGTKSTYYHPFCCIVRLVYLNSSLWEHKVECYKCLSRLLPRCKVDHQVLVYTRKIRTIVLLLLYLTKDRPALKHLHYIKCWWIPINLKQTYAGLSHERCRYRKPTPQLCEQVDQTDQWLHSPLIIFFSFLSITLFTSSIHSPFEQC